MEFPFKRVHFLEPVQSDNTPRVGLWKTLSTMEKAASYAVENDVPVMFVTEDTTRSKPEDVKLIYQRAMELGARRCVSVTLVVT